MRGKTSAFVVIALLGAGIAGYVLLNPYHEPPPLAQETIPPPSVPAPPAQEPAAPAEPAIRHPLDTETAVAASPEPGQGDALLLQALAKGLGKAWLAFLVPDELIHHIVATVDDLPRKHLPASVVPLKRAQGAFLTSGNGDALAIDAHNSVRYAAYVQLVQAVDSAKLFAVYRRFYPLFQGAYAELGYPKAYFNDRLVDAIDDLLAAPESEESFQLIQPKILYQFADPKMEALSAGQKIMIRLGRDNAARVKTKLREIRLQVAKVS